MQLEIHDNVLRLRLDFDEVGRIGVGDSVVATTHFPGGDVLEYRLSTGERLDARLEGAIVSVTVPAPEAERWAAADEAAEIHGQSGPVSVQVVKNLD